MNDEEESDECEEQSGETNGDGEMSCTGGCEGKWSRYNFNELDWNDDPIEEDGIVQCEQCNNWSHNNCVGRAATHNLVQGRPTSRLDLQRVCDRRHKDSASTAFDTHLKRE